MPLPPELVLPDEDVGTDKLTATCVIFISSLHTFCDMLRLVAAMIGFGYVKGNFCLVFNVSQ